jgi:hypothetical protein
MGAGGGGRGEEEGGQEGEQNRQSRHAALRSGEARIYRLRRDLSNPGRSVLSCRA